MEVKTAALGGVVEIRRATLDSCGQATGTVVVVDVIRAFTTAAYAFAAGAREIVLTASVEEALRLRQALPGSLVMGEVGGLPIEGFDFGNSPSALIGVDLSGRRLIQRTSAGTQGVVRSTRASALVASSFVCAGATARHLRRDGDAALTFVPTGAGPDLDGDEDVACADYIEALLCAPQAPHASEYLARVLNSRAGRIFADPGRPEFPAADLKCCVALDRFDFAMPVCREDGLLVMRAQPV